MLPVKTWREQKVRESGEMAVALAAGYEPGA